VLVLHTIPQTAAALPAILDALAAKDLRPVSLEAIRRAGDPA